MVLVILKMSEWNKTDSNVVKLVVVAVFCPIKLRLNSTKSCGTILDTILYKIDSFMVNELIELS